MNFKIKRIGIKFLCDTKIDEKKNIYCVSIEWYKFIFNFTISEAHFISLNFGEKICCRENLNQTHKLSCDF